MEKTNIGIKELILILFTFLPLILGIEIPFILYPSISLISISVFLYFTYNKISNAVFFSILAFLLTVIFPLTHYIIYSVGKDNYKFEREFLVTKSQSIKKELENRINVNYLKYILMRNDSFLELDKSTLIKDKLYKSGQYMIQYRIDRIPRGTEEFFNIYDTLGNYLAKLSLTGNNIKVCIKNEIIKQEELTKYSKTPSEFISPNDFWIESITAFSFGNIKSKGNLVLFIRGLQYIVAFIFITILTNTMKSMELFILKKKQ